MLVVSLFFIFVGFEQSLFSVSGFPLKKTRIKKFLIILHHQLTTLIYITCSDCSMWYTEPHPSHLTMIARKCIDHSSPGIINYEVIDILC